MSVIAADLFGTRARSASAATASMAGEAELRAAMTALLAHLLALIEARGGIVVHVTAAGAGEGTTTIARGLAAAGARTEWCRTALIDAGPATAGAGLLERMTATAEPPLRREFIDGAAVDTGALQSSGGGVANTERLRGLFGGLRAHYGLTVLDCPPVAAAPAAAAMARLTDGVLLVVGAGRAGQARVVQARGQLEQFGAVMLGAVFNRHQERLPHFLARRF